MKRPRKNSMTEAVFDSFGYKPKTVKELAAKLGLTYKQVSGCCRNLMDDNKIKRVADGTYQLITSARKPRKNSIAEKILDEIGDTPVTIGELASKLGLTYEQVSGCCSHLILYRKIKRFGRGAYISANGETGEALKPNTQIIFEAIGYEPIGIKNLAARLNLPYEKVRACCYSLSKFGKIKRVERGVYCRLPGQGVRL